MQIRVGIQRIRMEMQGIRVGMREMRVGMRDNQGEKLLTFQVLGLI